VFFLFLLLYLLTLLFFQDFLDYFLKDFCLFYSTVLPHHSKCVCKTAHFFRVFNKHLLDFVEVLCKTRGFNLVHENSRLLVDYLLTDLVLQVSRERVEQNVDVVVGHYTGFGFSGVLRLVVGI
jgi:ferric iron reductase protein FhuF